MAVTRDYLWLRDAQFNKIGIIEPESFVCECGFKGGSNSIEFELPSSAPLIEVGSFVNYGSTEYGGRIMSRDINVTKKTVKYYGKSWYGTFDDYIVETGQNDRLVVVQSEITFPGNQSALSGTFGSVTYPNNGPVPLMHWDFEHYHLPFESELFEVYDLPNNQTKGMQVPLGTSLAGLIQNIYDTYSQVCVLQYRGDTITDYSASQRILKFRVRNKKIWWFNIDSGDDLGDVIITDTYRPTAKFDFSTSSRTTAIHYIAEDDTYKTASSVMTIANWPSDLKYKGASQYTLYDPNEHTAQENRDDLKRIRNEHLSDKLATEVSRPYRHDTFDEAALGDFIRLTIREMKYQNSQCLIGKRLEYNRGKTTLIYVLGGYENN